MNTTTLRGLTFSIGGLGLIALAAAAFGMLPLPEADAGASLWLVFLTGLSVGGLSCLAVQGGLLAALIARRPKTGAPSAEPGGSPASADRYGHLGVVILFLVAKSAAYTALGALLGLFGSRIPLSLHGWMLIAAGVFMLVTALQLYDVHPILRHLTITPPKRLQRLVRSQTRRSDRLAPIALGALTVFIPCGVTVAMEVMAVASHSPARGAAIMLAFTLGTAPLFLLVGAAASRLERGASGLFRPLAAVTILVIAMVSIVSGARLLGYDPFRPSGPKAQAGLVAVDAPVGPVGQGGVLDAGGAAGGASGGTPGAAGGPTAPMPVAPAVQEITVQVTTGAYQPARIGIRPGIPTRLHLVTENTRGCIRAFVIPSLGIERMLPATGTETVDLPAVGPGRIDFMCSMGMYTGVIEVGDAS